MKTLTHYLLLSVFSTGLLYSTQSHGTSASDLAYYLPPGEVVWLTSEPTTTNEEAGNRYLLLERENHQAFDRGSIVLIPELGTHPYQSTTIRTLYQTMNDYGWFTYALQPPTIQVSEIAWQEESGERYPVGQYPLEIRNQLAERIRLAFTHARQQAGPLIVITEGVSAALLTDLLANGELPAPDALIVSGIYYPQWQLNRELATTLAQLQVVTLDLAAEGSNRWVEATQELRRQQAQRHQHIGYRQRVIPAGRHAEQPRFLTHTVYGWLRYEDL